MNRVVITGMGVVAPVGNGVPEFWSALCRGTCGIGPITRFDASAFDAQQAGEVKGFHLPPGLADKIAARDPLLRDDPGFQFLLAASAEALRSAAWAEFPDGGRATGLALATNFGNMLAGEQLLACPTSTANAPALGRLLDAYTFQSAADALAHCWQINGPRATLSLSCAAGTAVIGYAWELIRAGRAKVMLAGAYDSLSRFCWSGLCALRTMTRDKLRPFDKTRNGTLFGEGAAVLILEDMACAAARNAPLLAEVIGFGSSNNAFHMTAPDKEGAGLRRAMEVALRSAGIAPDQVDHVNAHGTGTKYNDLAETQAIKALLGPHAYTIPINSIKSMTGHTMGAAGGMEAIASVLSIRDGIVPPTINYRDPDPECDLNYTTNHAQRRAIRTVLSNSAGIGGCNAAILLRQVQP